MPEAFDGKEPGANYWSGLADSKRRAVKIVALANGLRDVVQAHKALVQSARRSVPVLIKQMLHDLCFLRACQSTSSHLELKHLSRKRKHPINPNPSKKTAKHFDSLLGLPLKSSIRAACPTATARTRQNSAGIGRASRSVFRPPLGLGPSPVAQNRDREGCGPGGAFLGA